MVRVKLMVVVAAAAVWVAAAAEAQPFKVVDVRAKVKPTEPSLWGVKVPSMPAGEAEDNLDLVNFEGVCCQFDASCDLPGPYNRGALLALNTYWNETMPDPYPPGAQYQVTWSQALLPDGSAPPLVILFNEEPVNFGDLSAYAGLNITLCVASLIEVPAEAAGFCNVAMGFKVTTPGGTIPPTVVDSFGVNPCP
jgi:hypothetical protein